MLFAVPECPPTVYYGGETRHEARLDARFDEVLMAISKSQVSEASVAEMEQRLDALDSLHAKVDVLVKHFEVIAQNVEHSIIKGERVEAVQSLDTLSIKQSMETLSAVHIQHLSAAEEKLGRKMESILQNVSQSEDMLGRQMETISADIKRAQDMLRDTLVKTDEQTGEICNLIRASSIEVRKDVQEVPFKFTSAVEPVLTAQREALAGQVSDFKSAVSFGLESVVERMRSAIESELSNVKASSSALTHSVGQQVGEQVQRNSRGIEEIIQASFRKSQEHVSTKIDAISSNLSSSIRDASETIVAQFLQTGSSMHESTAKNIQQQMASFQAVQLRQYGNLEKKFEESALDVDKVQKLADHLIAEGVYQQRRPGTKYNPRS
jgi:cytochrome c556